MICKELNKEYLNKEDLFNTTELLIDYVNDKGEK